MFEGDGLCTRVCLIGCLSCYGLLSSKERNVFFFLSSPQLVKFEVYCCIDDLLGYVLQFLIRCFDRGAGCGGGAGRFVVVIRVSSPV